MQKKNIITICIGLPIFLILAISIMLHAAWITGFDNFFEQLVHTIPGLKGLMLKITFLADTKVDLVWMLLIAVILWFRRQRPLALSIVITMVTADAVGYVIKHIVQRSRPLNHLAVDDGFSFPSGHTLGMVVIVFWLILIMIPVIVKSSTTRIWLYVLLIVWLIIVMISRVYVYAHFPSDVCGSVAFSVTWVGIVDAIWDKLTPRTQKNNF
ncbi:phosphatase PAP2 family protein [Lactobacillus kefiranofaciens]|uniref:Membrane-associated phospholipid phosphatase n=1 Tax=Lactobacillus kefiranofaciens TaxID=267818 RepID=A0AAX3UF75_9LACO|nr:phosphatase PAP2 family protein [Lactobacillus kefiranofaciens]AEG40365.1 possible phosphatidic acid phosphatase [Lactobacillus kefiranofaciens subsp. kefiranofaciens]KRM21423.1 phosphatidic acid phosphatase [Lactobacillus kefiranofaciens subsp. kefiranofaciens DSM 5016 = JCM 6985]QFQ67907.1 phosphatase PAP2 family protein [Lactobacillus kefiranofaciens subsp. kefiranofaciens]WGO86322.1 phosphatase PAP2 family protein [Lactobacillus kefiranofaciens]WQH36358.1 phosphatase PAP2 family protein